MIFLLIKSLQHHWINTCSLEKIPVFYLKSLAALQDVVNVFSRILNESCYSFISSDLDEVPSGVIFSLHNNIVEASERNIQQILDEIKIT